mgnify:CR=1 FL=1
MARERWYFIRNGELWKHTENDGPRFLRHGAEEREEPVPLNHPQYEEFLKTTGVK